MPLHVLVLFSGKTPDKDGPPGRALLCEVSSLFEMLMTQKADTHPGPRPYLLYQLSAVCRRSPGLDSATIPYNTQGNSGNAEKRTPAAVPTGLI